MQGSNCVCLPALLAVFGALCIPSGLLAQSERGHALPEVPLSSGFPDSPLTGHPGLREGIRPPAVSLAQMVRAAGTIFSGTVTEIRRHPAAGRQPIGTVEIGFHVDQSIRGAIPGTSVTILEWAGAWYASQSYRVGDRVLLFLYPPSKLGLTSCVDGTIGRFPIGPTGRVTISARQLEAFHSDPVLGGRLNLKFSDFALAIQRVSEER
jgi:hypothetical protein